MTTAAVAACERAPRQSDVDAVRDLLDLMQDFPNNDQRARFLLSSNWLRDSGADAAAHLHARLASLTSGPAAAGGPLQDRNPNPK